MTTGLNRLIVKLIFVLVLLSVAATGFTATTALQVDFLLSGMRDPETDEPLNGGLVYFYDSGTTSSETVYLDRDKVSESTNPVVLDAYGRAVVFVDGVVDVTVTNASGTTVWSDTGLDYQNIVDTTSFTTFTQNVDAAGYKLYNLADPTANQDAATKLYVDTEITTTEGLITDLGATVATLTFTDLVDTPSGYSGNDLIVTSNSTGDALEFKTFNSYIEDSSFLDLVDTPITYAGSNNYVLSVNTDGDGSVEFTDVDTLTTPSTYTNFLALSDTPASYTGAAGFLVKVNSTSDGLEVVDSDKLISFLDLDTVTPTTYIGNAGKAVTVNSGETGVEFASLSGTAPTGAIMMWPSTAAAPTGWLICNGQAVSRTTYEDLLDVIGTAYNDGTEGINNFRLPDLRGMFLKGAGTNVYSGITTGAGNAYSGSTAGSFETDQFQGHDHTYEDGTPGTVDAGGPSNPLFGNIKKPTEGVVNDYAGLYGTARPGEVTEPAHFTVNYIIKH